MPQNPELPTCISIILCDDVYRDERTKKLIIVGTFNNINARSFPCVHQKMTILFTLTNAKGTYDLALSVESAKTGHLICEMKGPAQLNAKLQTVDVDVALQNLSFPEPGKYWITLKADGEIISQRPFTVKHVEAEKKE